MKIPWMVSCGRICGATVPLLNTRAVTVPYPSSLPPLFTVTVEADREPPMRLRVPGEEISTVRAWVVPERKAVLDVILASSFGPGTPVGDQLLLSSQSATPTPTNVFTTAAAGVAGRSSVTASAMVSRERIGSIITHQPFFGFGPGTDPCFRPTLDGSVPR